MRMVTSAIWVKHACTSEFFKKHKNSTITVIQFILRRFKRKKLLTYKDEISKLIKARKVNESVQNHSPSARISRAFLNSRNIPKCLDQAIQTRKP